MAKSFLGLGGDIVTSKDGLQWLGWISPFLGTGTINSGSSNSSCVVTGGDKGGTPVATRSTNGHTFAAVAVANPHSTDLPYITGIGINDSFGAAVGVRPLSTPGNQAELWTSNDNGLTWTDVAQPSFLSGIGLVGFGQIYCDNTITIVYGRIGNGPFTQFAMTTTDGSAWVASTTPTKFIYKMFKTASHYYALAFDDDSTGWLGISTDAINWTYKSQPLDSTYWLQDIAASDSLIVIVGANSDFSVGFIETSADGGNSWTSVSIDSSIAEVDTVAFNGTVWAATGGVMPEFDDVAIRSSDGVTWTLIHNIGEYSCAVLLLYDVIISTSNYNLYIYDDCCHLLSSFDLGISWAFSFQNVATLSDAYIDLSMAIADGDYTTMLSYNANYTYPDGTSSQNGQLALSKSAGRTGTWAFSNPDPVKNIPHDNSNFITWHSGALTKNAQTMILMPATAAVGGVETDVGFIRITNDGGATWSDTAVSLGARQWFYACIAKGGQIMYAMSKHSPAVSKSTDGGATWVDLAASPNIVGFVEEGAGRIRCSDNGSIVIVAIDGSGTGAANAIYLSKDGGTTWSSPVTLVETSSQCDAALSSDGSVMMALDIRQAGPQIKVWYSIDTGTTWNLHDLTGDLPANSDFAACCNVSPDGLVMLVGWPVAAGTGFGHAAAVSLNSGATWHIYSIPSFFDNPVVAAYVTPSPPCNPYAPCSVPPTPPFVPPKGGYIIERFDNRVWPTVENAWCVDCGFELARPTPDAKLNASSSTGAGILTGVTDLVGGENYSSTTTVQVIDGNGLGPGTGAVAVPTISGGSIVAITFGPGGSGYIYPNLVFNDPTNAGSGASATITMDNSVTFFASAPVFVFGDVGSVIRVGYGVADITGFTNSQTVTANLRSPIVNVQPDDPADPGEVPTQTSGTWTMTKPISQFYLPTLAGFEITGLADGQVIPPVVVPSNGIVTLAQPASAIIVGLGFQAQLQSTYLDAGEPTVQAQRKKIAEVSVRVEQSASFQAGGNQPDGSVQSPQQLAPLWQNMIDVPSPAVPPFNSAAQQLFTGDIRVPIPSGFNTRGQVAVQQLKPLPLQVLDYVPEILSGDKPAQEAPQRQRGKGGGGGQQQ